MEELTCEDLPTYPPQKVIDWAANKLLSSVHAMVYRAAFAKDPLTGLLEKCVSATCSACGHSFQFDRVEVGACRRACSPALFGYKDQHGTYIVDGNNSICPHCGAPVTAKHIGSYRGKLLLHTVWPLTVSKVQGRLVLSCWRIARKIDKDANESLEITPYLAYVVEDKKIKCFQGFYQFFQSITHLDHWEDRKTYQDKYGKLGPVYPWDKRLLIGTTAENSKLDLYMKCPGDLYPVSYLKLWTRRPHVENLLMAGAGKLLSDMIRRECRQSYVGITQPKLDSINWREKRPAKMLGLTKEELRTVVADKWDEEALTLYRKIIDRGQKIDPAMDMAKIRKFGVPKMESILRVAPADVNVMRALRYIEKQHRKDTAVDYSYLCDYWSMAKKNGADLSDMSVRYPQNLHRAHDQEAIRQRFVAQEPLREKFAERTKFLSGFAFESDGLLIRPVADQEELYQEGAILNHCVYSYASSHANANSAIFLIRKISDPHAPFFTLELDERRIVVRQNRGRKNCARTPEVQAFEEKWLAWAKEQIQKVRKSA